MAAKDQIPMSKDVVAQGVESMKKKRRLKRCKNVEKPVTSNSQQAVDEEEHADTESQQEVKNEEKKKREREENDKDEEKMGEKEIEEIKREMKSGGIMSTETFSSLPISENTMKGINDLNFEYMTQVHC